MKYLIYAAKFSVQKTVGAIIEVPKGAPSEAYQQAYSSIERYVGRPGETFSDMLLAGPHNIERHQGLPAFCVGLSMQGAHYILVVPLDCTQEHIKAAKASLRHTNDVVSLKVIRLDTSIGWQPPKPFTLISNPETVLYGARHQVA